LLLVAPPGARAGSDILVSVSLAPGGTANRARAELVYDPLQLEAVGTPVATPGRLPMGIDGSAGIRFRVLLAGGRAQLRIENAVGIDSRGATVPVEVSTPVDITVTP
jgi:hypothetical protein